VPTVTAAARAWAGPAGGSAVARSLLRRRPQAAPAAEGVRVPHALLAVAGPALLAGAALRRPVGRSGGSDRAREAATPSAASSGSDSLLYESLNREANKLKSGKKRQVDAVPVQRRPRAPPRRVPSSGGFSASTSDRPGLLVRLFAAACLLPPLVIALPYGFDIVARIGPLREVILRPLLPLVKAYYSSRVGGLLTIAALYGLVAKNRSMPPFMRTIGAQSATLMMMQLPAGFLLQFFVAAPKAVQNVAYGAVFAYFVYCIALGLLSCATGQTRPMPGIGEGGLPTGRMRGISSGFRPPSTFRGSS